MAAGGMLTMSGLDNLWASVNTLPQSYQYQSPQYGNVQVYRPMEYAINNPIPSIDYGMQQTKEIAKQKFNANLERVKGMVKSSKWRHLPDSLREMADEMMVEKFA